PTYFLKVLVGNSNVRFHSFIFFLIKFTSLKLIIYKMENKLLYIYSTFIEKIACTVLQYVKENFNCSPQETVNPDIPLLLTVSAASRFCTASARSHASRTGNFCSQDPSSCPRFSTFISFFG